nr:Uridylate kinase [Ipomoea batatas]
MLIAREISIACRVGVEVAAAVGGRIGNFFCGDSWVTSDSLDGCTAYQLGIMEILMNSMLLLSAKEKGCAAGSSCKAGKVEMVTSRLPSSDQATAVVKKVFPSLCSVQVNVQNTEPGTNTENHRQHPPPFLVEEQTMNVDVDGAGSASSHDVPEYITDSKHLVNGQLARRMLDLVILAELDDDFVDGPGDPMCDAPDIDLTAKKL